MSERADRIAGRLRGYLAALSSGRRLRWPGGAVSFTFDDFPKSALVEGGAILEQRRARGTFYAASGLAGSDGPLGPLFDTEDLRRAAARGHEVGCHTFGHLNCAETPKAQLLEDVRINAADLAEVLGEDRRPTSFAFPFGAAGRQARQALKPLFSSCRGIQPGLNRRAADLAELKANKIYHREYDPARIRALVDQACATDSWLIFYTHDVAERPSAYGCRPAQLEEAVAYAVSRSSVLTVAEAVARIR